MGRKSKRKHNQDPEDIAKADKKEILALCTQLLELAGRPSAMAPAKQWEEFLQINSLVEKIRKKQHDHSFEGLNREDHIDEFMAWAKSQGINSDSVAIQSFDDQGLGLRAVKEIKGHDSFLTVPRRAMLTEDCVLKSPLGPLVSKDRVLQGMAHVALALYLLIERHSEPSNWKPYIDILPSSYQVPLYFTPDELQHLQGSPTYTDALKQHKNIARQFAYFYKLFQVHADATKLSLKDTFTYDGYRWAVSTVMSRQNQIPSEDGSHLVTVLIPLWDMCNHTNGVITTSFNLQKDSCDGLALHDLSIGDQVCIFYGLRSNSHLLLYSGFVYPESECDSVSIQLGISRNDRLYAMKSQLLAMMGSAESSINLAVEGGDNPISPELIAFLRVFSMDEKELVSRMFDKNKTESLGRLIRPNCLVSKANELRVWAFLEARLGLLLRQYKTSIEDDVEELSRDNLSANSKLCIQLRLSEKRILHNAITYIQGRKKDTEQLADDATCYSDEVESDNVKVANNSEQKTTPECKAGAIDMQSDDSSSYNRNSTCSLQSDSSEDSVLKQIAEPLEVTDEGSTVTDEGSTVTNVGSTVTNAGSTVTNADVENSYSQIKLSVGCNVDSLNNTLNGINLNEATNTLTAVPNGHESLNGSVG